MEKLTLGPKLIGNELKKIIITITLPQWDSINAMEIANSICGGTNYRKCKIKEENEKS